MAIRAGLAKVAGAVRCNRWGSHLEGEAAPDRKTGLVPSIPAILEDTQAYIEQETLALRKRRRAR